MTPIKEKRKQRFQFLNFVYEYTDGNEDVLVDMCKIEEALTWNKDTSNLVCQYLVGKEFVQFVTFGHISITPEGRDAIEKALTQPEEATNYFPAVIKITNNYSIQGDNVEGDKAGGDKVEGDKIRKERT